MIDKLRESQRVTFTSGAMIRRFCGFVIPHFLISILDSRFRFSRITVLCPEKKFIYNPIESIDQSPVFLAKTHIDRRLAPNFWLTAETFD